MISYFGNLAHKATVLPNGVDTNLFTSKDRPPRKGNLLFVGALEHGKGLHILLNSLSTIPDSLKWNLTVVGIGKEGVSLRSQALKLGLSDKIEWLGAIPYQDMPGVYESHDFLVVPSLHETFSMVCAEALACKRPVIASRCGGPQEVVPVYGGRLVPAGDVDALSKCLVEALSGLLYFEADRAVEHIKEKFSMEGIITNLENAYADLISTGS